MKRALTIGVTGMALAATLSVVTVRARSQEPQADAPPVNESVDRVTARDWTPTARLGSNGPYFAGPRIIHVPQPGEDDVASVPNVRRVMPDDDDDAEDQPAPPPRRQSAPRPQKQKANDTPPAPRRKPYGAAVQERPAPVERRTVLRAPVHDGPTPVRPTPRFVKETGSKFPPPPPPGYTPPSNLPQEAAPAAEAASPQEPAAETAPPAE